MSLTTGIYVLKVQEIKLLFYIKLQVFAQQYNLVDITKH